MIAIQYDIFESKEETEKKAIEKKIYEMDASLTKVRKCLFAKNGELNKRLREMEDRLEILERNICQK